MKFKKGHIPWNKGKAFNLAGTSFYKVWQGMKFRCYNKNHDGYKMWGGRGIRVCKRWHNFRNFYKDMYSTYKKGLSLDRIDNNSDYSPKNCRWATKKQQARNSRNIERAKHYVFKGLRLTVRELAEKFRIKRTTLDMRLRVYNWSIKRALEVR